MSTAGSKRAEARRAAKAAAQEKAKQVAIADASVRKDDVLAKQAADEKARAEAGLPPVEPQPKRTRREVIDEARGRAEKRADADSRAVAPDAATVAASFKGRPGDPIPLNVLNARAEMINKVERDEARVIANAAGKSVYDTLQNIAPRSKHGKFRKMREMANTIAKHEAKTS